MHIVVFWEEGFPFLDTRPQGRESLRAAANANASVDFVSADLLPSALASAPDLVVNPYGSGFPAAAVSAMLAYLQRGGAWLNVGGVPMTRLATAAGASAAGGSSGWCVDAPTNTLLEQLRLGPADEVPLPSDASFACPLVDVAIETVFHRYRPHAAWGFAPGRLTQAAASGHGGRMRPVVVAESGGRRVVAPVVAVDWTSGPYAGGRWVLCACRSARPAPTELLRRLYDYSSRPRAEVWARPSFACYYPGEMPSLRVEVAASPPGDLRINVRAYSVSTQREVYAHLFRARSGAGPATVRTVPFAAPDPGLYVVRVLVETPGHNKPVGAAESAFWVVDRDMLRRAPAPAHVPAVVVRHAPPAGHADPFAAADLAAWDADLAAASAAGIDTVAVELGPWDAAGGPDALAMSETYQRAAVAYALTARRHRLRLEVRLPAAARCDADALRAQVAGTASLAHRLADATGLAWRVPDGAPLGHAAALEAAVAEAEGRGQEILPAEGTCGGDAVETGAIAWGLESAMVRAVSGGRPTVHAGEWHARGHAPALVRADGTETPDLAAVRAVTRFLRDVRPHLSGRRAEPAVVVRPPQPDAGNAVREAVRTLEQDLGIACRVSPPGGPGLDATARLVVVPAPRNPGGPALDALTALAAEGAVVLLSGAQASGLPALDAPAPVVPVAATEPLAVDGGDVLLLHFDADAHPPAVKPAGATTSAPAAVRCERVGRGWVVLCPLPIELAQAGVTAPVYRAAAALAGLPVRACGDGVVERAVEYDGGTLVALLNATGCDRAAGLGATGLPAKAGGAALAFIDRVTGHVLASTAAPSGRAAGGT